MIGTKLGPYEIIEELGQGGMATVYRAYQPRMDRHVAIKVIRSSIIEDTNARERFQREARIIARLEHPHLLPIYDFDGAHDPPYIVMRYLEGGTLKEVLTSRQLPFDETTYLLRQVGSALDYAHRQGVVHRDIKPSNIMVDQEGNAFVMDFGIARMTGRDGADGGLTGTGTIIGTPDYMAPEQGFGSAEVDLRADVYSEGIMLFEMVTGQLPFKGKTPMETMLHHLSKPVPSAHEINPEVPKELDKVILKACAKEPADRYPSVVEFTAEVIQVLGERIATTPVNLQKAAQESVALTDQRRSGIQEQIEATMAEFAADRLDQPAGSGSTSTTGPAQQHRTVTALYADVAEYNELIELEQGAENAQRAVRDLWSSAAEIVGQHGGAVFSQSDRDLLVLWGAVSAHEDDPERAVLSALAVRDSLGSKVNTLIPEDEPFPIRIALNTGPALIDVDTSSGSYSASGATVNLANRVANNADGLVLITQETYRHIQGIFDIEEDRPLRIRRAGGMAMVNTYRVNEAKPRAFRLQPRGIEGVDTQMVGRRAELEEIQKAYYAAVEDSETQVITVVSPPGLGKSRLLYEFAAWAELRPERFFIFRGRATPAMTNRPYGLWRDILSFRFEILDSDSPEIVRQKIVGGIADLIGENERLAHLIGYLAGFDFEGSPHLAGDPKDVSQQGRKAVLKFIRLLAEKDAVVIQLEDLHHADDPSLDLLVEISSSDEELPFLLVALARPALYERRANWGSGQEFHVRIDLRPLSKRDSRELASEILQKIDDVPRELRDLLVERAEGNPHYMEELVKMLVEDRVIQKVDKDRWLVEGSRLKGLRVPPTLVSLLQARFDSLLYPEKLTLQRAAVVGRVFYDSAVSALDAADQTHVDDLAGILSTLAEREFVYPRESSAFEGSREFIFGQAMMRDLILETLLENQTKPYHQAMAQWLSIQGGERAGEYDGLIANHYELAGENYLAAEFLAKASKAGIRVSAYQEGIKSGERALDLLSQSEQSAENIQLRLEILMELADVQAMLGRYDEARTILQSALKEARNSGDRATEANALAHLGRLEGTFLDNFEPGLEYLEQALAINQEINDKPGLIFILRQLGNIFFNTNNLEESIDNLEQSLKLAKELDDIESTAHALNSLGLAVWSAGEIERGLDYFLEAVDSNRQRGDKLSQAMNLHNIGWANAELENFSAAQEAADECLAIVSEKDSRSQIAGIWTLLAWIPIGTGQYDTAREMNFKAAVLNRNVGDSWGLANCLLGFARLKSLTSDEHIEALEWMGVCQAHYFYNVGGVKRLVDAAIAEAGADLPDSEVQAALARGAEMDFDEVMDGILAEEA